MGKTKSVLEFFTNYAKMLILAFLSFMHQNKKKSSGDRTQASHNLISESAFCTSEHTDEVFKHASIV